MKTLREELNDFISTISKDEMKHNHKLRERIKILKKRMGKGFPIVGQRGPTLLNHLGR